MSNTSRVFPWPQWTAFMHYFSSAYQILMPTHSCIHIRLSGGLRQRHRGICVDERSDHNEGAWSLHWFYEWLGALIHTDCKPNWQVMKLCNNDIKFSWSIPIHLEQQVYFRWSKAPLFITITHEKWKGRKTVERISYLKSINLSQIKWIVLACTCSLK